VDKNMIIISAVACICAFLALVTAGGLGFYLMNKKKKASDDAPSPTDGGDGESSDAGSDPELPLDPSRTDNAGIVIEPAITQDAADEEIDAPRTTSVLEEPIPDPAGVGGLDSVPIIASDTLDEDEAESPTVIIPRGADPEEEA